MTDPRYPVGPFDRRAELTPDERTAMIANIAETPARMRKAVAGLNDAQLDTPYREGGWSVRQVVHHVPDSHMNAYIRLKLGLTADQPNVTAYDEAVWAAMSDSRDTPIEVSLTLLESLHDRWTRVLRAMTPDDFRRKINHPENGPMTLDMVLGMYAWHGRHHVAHITTLRERMGW